MGKYLHKYDTEAELKNDYNYFTISVQNITINGGPLITFGDTIVSSTTHDYDGEYVWNGRRDNESGLLVFECDGKELYGERYNGYKAFDGDLTDDSKLGKMTLITSGNSSGIAISQVSSHDVVVPNKIVINGFESEQGEITHNYDGEYFIERTGDGDETVYKSYLGNILVYVQFLSENCLTSFSQIINKDTDSTEYGIVHCSEVYGPKYIEPWVSLTEECGYLKSFRSRFGGDFMFTFEYQGMGECYPYGRKHMWKGVGVYTKYVATNANDFINYNITDGTFVAYVQNSEGGWYERTISVNSISNLVYDDTEKVHYNHDDNNYIKINCYYDGTSTLTGKGVAVISEIGDTFNNDENSVYIFTNLDTGEERTVKNGPVFFKIVILDGGNAVFNINLSNTLFDNRYYELEKRGEWYLKYYYYFS